MNNIAKYPYFEISFCSYHVHRRNVTALICKKTTVLAKTFETAVLTAGEEVASGALMEKNFQERVIELFGGKYLLLVLHCTNMLTLTDVNICRIY